MCDVMFPPNLGENWYITVQDYRRPFADYNLSFGVWNADYPRSCLQGWKFPYDHS